MEAMAPDKSKDGKPTRILSISSHVVRGYVGNRASVFPLQLLGFQVDFINSVQFSSMFIHEGQTLSGEELKAVLGGLMKAQKTPRITDHPGACAEVEITETRTDYTHILTGYMGDAGFLREAVKFVRSQKASETGNLMWLCDPILGDNGRIYVSKEVVEVFRNEVLQFADVLTPNHYELQWLCGIEEPVETFSDVEAVLECCMQLHRKGPHTIVVTSVPLESEPSSLYLVGSQSRGENQQCAQKGFFICFPRLSKYLGGTGDLMASMLLASLIKTSGDLEAVCENALSIVQDVMNATVAKDPNSYEIDVVGSQKLILTPVSRFTAKEVSPHQL